MAWINPGLGIEYEIHLASYFALLLNTNPEIEDFKLQSNVQEFGYLDDLLVDIKTRSGENLYFAFQLKYKEKSGKNLLPTNFEARGDFNLEKYCETFKKLNEENRTKYHFILYTNKNFDDSRTNEVKRFVMRQDECCVGRNFFNTSSDGKHLYRFELNEETEDGKNVNKKDFEEFFSKFSLYTGQTNFRDLEKSILYILKHNECYATYIDFFRKWHRGDFTNKIIDKKTLNVHLIDIFLSSVAINYHFSDGLDGNSIFFEEMVQQFDITVINASKTDFVDQLEKNIHKKYPDEFKKQEDMFRLAKDHKFVNRYTKELTEDTKLKLLRYFYQKPLIIDFNTNSMNHINEASKLCDLQETRIKLVIMGKDVDVSKFSHLKIFTNLTQVDGNFLEETKKRCKLSLQGRNISFEEIFEDKIREFVTPKEIFLMLKGNFSIGEDKENLPEYYIPRTVSTKVFDIELIITHSSRSAVLIFNCEDKLEEVKTLIQKIIDCEDFLLEYLPGAIMLRTKECSKRELKDIPTIILRKEEFSRKQLEEIWTKMGKDDFYSFKVIDKKRCLLLMSTKDTYFKENYEYTKLAVEENNIHVFFNNAINLLCAQPGMGKSTLMKYLKNECDPNFWTLRIDLKAHNQFLKENGKIEDVLNYFIELENCQDIFLLNIKRMFLEKEKIILFLDGLDEVEIECVDYVLNITSQLSEMGFRIWLSSRQNLQQKLEQYFNIFAIEINKLNEDQQKTYIEKRLTSQYCENEIEEIVDIIFSNTGMINNREILEIPLQLNMITQTFLDDKSYYFNLNRSNFNLTKIFEIFFQGKYKHYLAKIDLKHTHLLRGLEEQLETYEIVALHSVLDDEHFQKLQIEKLKSTQIKNSDFLSIIMEVNSKNKAVFEHLTFAEYFASKFLVKNFDKARILREEIFTEKYQNLLLIFNIMLAEDSPLHLAIIYKDLSRIKKMQQSTSMVDKGGRNFLQVAASVATRHPVLESKPKPFSSECMVKDKSVQHFRGEDWKIKEIVNRVLLSEPFNKDMIFHWNSLDYALVNGALYIVEAILEKFEKPSNFYEILGKYYNDEVVAYYSIRFGYHRLLSEIITKKSCHVTGILSDYLGRSDIFEGNNSILHFLFIGSDCTNRTKIIELLTDDNINKIVNDEEKYTFLHFAVLHEDTKIVKFLLEKRADVHVRNKDGKTPLVWAVERNNLEISKMLAEKGADVTIQDKDGTWPLSLADKQKKPKVSELIAYFNCRAREQSTVGISKLLVEKKGTIEYEVDINPGLGIEYEVHLPAYFALLLNTNPEIEDFKLQSNVQEFGNLDDLLVDIKTRSGENLYFAFQLKHKKNSHKKLLPTNFEARGDLEKYCEAFKNLNEENRKKYHFILYTNINFDPSRTSEVKKFDMRQDECCLGRNFFDTSGEGKHLYKFEVNKETIDGKNVNKEDFREFFSKFYIYTGQANIRDLEKSIFDILKYRECYVIYIDFFRRWHRGDFIDKIIDKKTLNIHLVDIFLSSIAINHNFSDGQDGNSIFFEEMVQQFDVTIIDASKQDFIKKIEENVHKYQKQINKGSEERMIRLATDSKFMDKFDKELTQRTKLKLLYYFFQKPLILDFNESSKDLIYEASKLCKIQENEIKLVILGQDIDVSKFSHLKIFTNLSEIDGILLEETKKRCKLSLQGRNISFEATFTDEIHKFVTPKEIFQMLKGNFSIGEDKENLPKCYIPRTVSTTVFDIESIIKHSSGTAAIIFYYEDKFEELKILIQNIVDTKNYLYEDFSGDIILRQPEPSKKQLLDSNIKVTLPEIPTIILRKESAIKQLYDIRKETGKDEVHFFKAIDGKRCLIMRTNKISHNEDYKYSKMSVEEDNIHVVFNNSINILCGQPGMGKSTVMKYLKNECDSDFWTVMVDLKANNQFLIGKQKIEEVLNYFLQLENCQDLFVLKIKKMFLEKRKIVFFVDGLDAVENECVDYVLDITRQLSDMGFRIWLSSRQNLQQKLEQYFNIFAIEINELNEDQQKNYIENRLTSQYNEDEIEEIVKKINNNTDLANNRQILEIPLQLHIITQLFLEERSYHSNLNENSFIVTKMFKIFFEGKCKQYLAKVELKYTDFLERLEQQLEKYEIVALQSVLDDEHFQELQIVKLKPTQIEKSDFLGIISEINSESKAMFVHSSFAEYFASKFLVKNFDKARFLREEIFSEKYQNLFLMFNIMLAEDSRLHLAIIYKDLSQIQEMEESSLVDNGGRTPLQVAACVATRHPPLQKSSSPYKWYKESFIEDKSLKQFKEHPLSFVTECWVKDKTVQHFKGEDLKIKEIVNRVLSLSNEPFKNDKIFEWNSLEYALVNGALYIVEAILEKSEKPPNFYKMLGKYYSDEVVSYYSIRFGYHRLLSEILANNSCQVTKIFSDCLSPVRVPCRDNSVMNFLFFTSDCMNRTKIVELISGDNINKTIYDKAGYTFLHFAVFHDDTELTQFLLGKKADINIQDKFQWTPLHFAVTGKKLEISKLLVQNGADVNIKDKNGCSPLFLPVAHNNIEISKLLVEKGADVNMKSKHGTTPLYWATRHNNLEVLKLLVEKGADVNIKYKEGKSLLFLAVKQNIFKISELLIKYGADVNIKHEDGISPLLLAVKQNNFKISELLIKNGADVNIKDRDGKSPLFLAVKHNIFKISELLIKNGADVNVTDKNGKSPLVMALNKTTNIEISKLLIEHGADVNIIDKDGRSPLFWAAELNNIEISKLLIEKGADVNIKDKKYGRSPLFLAIKQGNFDVSKLLLETGAEF